MPTHDARFGEPHMVAEHDTWISLDPVIGCPADCAYCYLGPLRLKARRPMQRVDTASAGGLLRAYLYGRRSELIDPDTDTTPICLGNYTDMLMTRDNRRALLGILAEITSILSPRLLVLITKSALDKETVNAIDGFGWPVLWFFSQSFAFLKQGRLELGRVADFDTTIGNAELVTTTTNQRAAHFWRPFVRELIPPLAERHRIVERLKGSGMQCSVVLGMARGPGTPAEDRRLHEAMPSAFESDPVGSEVIDREAWREISTVARRAGYPMYRHSSCAIALAQSRPEQLGTWGGVAASERCLPCQCPSVQRRRCGSRKEQAADQVHMRSFADEVAKFLELESGEITYDVAKGLIHIHASVAEFDYNTILHAASGRYLISARSIATQKAWQGSFATVYSKQKD
ncbi:radical SAM family protein [Glycomyces albidus]|jgi:hypothetical protein|uniref:Uncharacterized protein n=1 Tax=Glycomyces albidus TaxID=2656774 RepID=A0A6L5GES0_9ACTN|nr:hypothetical protein [Glycomyces albidus]MQM28202.1 hypothetical protein [Glycomyces albidus]